MVHYKTMHRYNGMLKNSTVQLHQPMDWLGVNPGYGQSQSTEVHQYIDRSGWWSSVVVTDHILRG
jgi:hypothetical protein